MIFLRTDLYIYDSVHTMFQYTQVPVVSASVLTLSIRYIYY